MTVPQTLPASRDTVENSAAAKATIKPTMANRNRTQTCASPRRGKRDAAESCGLFCVGSGITGFSGTGRCFCQHMTAERRGEVTEDIARCAHRPQRAFTNLGCYRFSGGGWRRYLHHRNRITTATTIKTAILKRCRARNRLRQCCPNRYPALAMKVTQTAAPRKLKRVKARQRMRNPPASGPAKTRMPKT